MLVTLVIFTVAGFSHEATATDQIEQYSIALNNTFHITPWLLIVPVITGILIAKKSSVDHHAIHLGSIGRHVRVDFPATSIARNLQFTNLDYPIQFQGPVHDILRQHRHRNR